jgi:hypothetical protein
MSMVLGVGKDKDPIYAEDVSRDARGERSIVPRRL